MNRTGEENAVSRTEVLREDDGELIGFVEPDPATGAWRALSVFGGLVATTPDEESAANELRSRGLSVLAETWWLRGEPVVILEARPGKVVARVGGIPSLAVSAGDVPDGHIRVTLADPEIGELTLLRP
ncbi:hypothetical protein [Pseudonocardia ailaonensis]